MIAEVWRHGSVIGSWLLDLTAAALLEHPDLSGFAGRVSDSGEGRWTVMAAIEESVPAPVLSAALYERFSSRGEADFADRLLSAMRYQFGGHVERLLQLSQPSYKDRTSQLPRSGFERLHGKTERESQRLPVSSASRLR